MCDKQIEALVAVLNENVAERWPSFNGELASEQVPDTARRLGGEIVDHGMVSATNLIQVLGGNLDVAVLREYVTCVPAEMRAIQEWRSRLNGNGRRAPNPLERILALYEEQTLQIRSLQGIIECLDKSNQAAPPEWAWNAERPIPEAEPGPIKEPEHIVLLVHGIGTEAHWQERVAKLLRQTNVVDVVPLRYGYFDVFRFLGPWWTRLPPIHRLHRELRDVMRTHPKARVSVIAHSFGTYAICTLLEQFRDLEIDRLILCGSVVAEDFRWDRIREQVRHRVVNECGVDDVWPRLACACSWGYGASGARGFGAAAVRDRFHPGAHSDFFDDEFVTLYWVPFVLYGQIPESSFETSRPPVPWYLEMIGSLPLRWLIAAGVCLTAYSLLRALVRVGLL